MGYKGRIKVCHTNLFHYALHSATGCQILSRYKRYFSSPNVQTLPPPPPPPSLLFGLRMSGAIHLLLRAFMACVGTTLLLPLEYAVEFQWGELTSANKISHLEWWLNCSFLRQPNALHWPLSRNKLGLLTLQ
jgi:hypothetical protein